MRIDAVRNMSAHFKVNAFIAAPSLQCLGPSMMPTLNPAGDVVLLDCLPRWQANCLQAGDIVVARSPTNPRLLVCKRIAALEGSPMPAPLPPGFATSAAPSSLKDSRITNVSRLFPQSAREAVHMHWHHTSVTVVSMQKRLRLNASEITAVLCVFAGRVYQVVPRGHVWLQGDNARNSTDSRHYGPVPAALIRGKVLYRVSVYHWTQFQDIFLVCCIIAPSSLATVCRSLKNGYSFTGGRQRRLYSFALQCISISYASFILLSFFS